MRALLLWTARDDYDPFNGLNLMAMRVEDVDGESLIQPFIDIVILPELPMSERDPLPPPEWLDVEGHRVAVWSDGVNPWTFFYPKCEVMFLVSQNQSSLTMEEVLADLP